MFTFAEIVEIGQLTAEWSVLTFLGLTALCLLIFGVTALAQYCFNSIDNEPEPKPIDYGQAAFLAYNKPKKKIK